MFGLLKKYLTGLELFLKTIPFLTRLFKSLDTLERSKLRYSLSSIVETPSPLSKSFKEL